MMERSCSYVMGLMICLVLCVCLVPTWGQPGQNQTRAHPDGYWFGTQVLSCVLLGGSKGQEPRVKRHAVPTRNPVESVHRLLYYRNQVYEWGTGPLGYHYGPTPVVPQCDVTWELEPAGNSTCPDLAPTRFAREYREKYGRYHLLTNNCHQFANRMSKLLSSADCTNDHTRDRLLKTTRELGRWWDAFLSLLRSGEDEEEDVPIIS